MAGLENVLADLTAERNPVISRVSAPVRQRPDDSRMCAVAPLFLATSHAHICYLDLNGRTLRESEAEGRTVGKSFLVWPCSRYVSTRHAEAFVSDAYFGQCEAGSLALTSRSR